MSEPAAIDRESRALPQEAGTRLRGRIVERAGLGADERDAMFALLGAHFDGVDRAVFDADLAAKSLVILIEDGRGALRGFSTLLAYESNAPGRPVTVVYSGDTIVARGWWSSPALPRTWIQVVRRLAPVERGEVYWLLLTSGFRTYRFLPLFFRTFYPRYDAATPQGTQALVDALACERFGSQYDAAAGVVRFARPHVLSEDLITVPAERARDPHIGYFLARNPGFVAGDELVCVTSIRDDNLTPAGRRMAGLRES